ncbi:MAG: hypothetical protein ACLTGI_05960 [Hoylesella buccalis]
MVVDRTMTIRRRQLMMNMSIGCHIIFHVLYQNAEDATQYIPASRLQVIVRNVNELFQGGVYGEE